MFQILTPKEGRLREFGAESSLTKLVIFVCVVCIVEGQSWMSQATQHSTLNTQSLNSMTMAHMAIAHHQSSIM